MTGSFKWKLSLLNLFFCVFVQVFLDQSKMYMYSNKFPFHIFTEEMMNYKAYYKCTRICHACRCTKQNEMKAPASLATEYRHTLQTFREESIKPGPCHLDLINHKTMYLLFSSPRSLSNMWNPCIYSNNADLIYISNKLWGTYWTLSMLYDFDNKDYQH